MFFRHGRAGRLTVARLFTLALLAGAATACGAPLRVPDLTATANSRDGIVIEPVVSTSPTLASSLLADLPPLVPNAEAAATPQALSPPSATPAPAATSTVTTTPEATSTPRPGQTPVTPGAGTATPATTMTPPTTLTLVARTATPGTTATVTSVQAATVSGGDMGAQTVAALNAYRAQQGLPALRTSGTLTLAASNYAKLMADRNYFGHDGPDGSSPSGRMAAAGYGGRFKGEALAAGQTSPQGALNTWLNSPAHRDIVLDRSAVDVGIGYYSKPGTTYTTYWVLMTGVSN